MVKVFLCAKFWKFCWIFFVIVGQIAFGLIDQQLDRLLFHFIFLFSLSKKSISSLKLLVIDKVNAMFFLGSILQYCYVPELITSKLLIAASRWRFDYRLSKVQQLLSSTFPRTSVLVFQRRDYSKLIRNSGFFKVKLINFGTRIPTFRNFYWCLSLISWCT